MGPGSDPRQNDSSPSNANGPRVPETAESLRVPHPMPRFGLGQIVITPGALEAISHDEITSALTRHARGDWGLVDPEDWKENELSVREGFRLLSAYETHQGRRFWVITEADRSSTCLLLPEEY